MTEVETYTKFRIHTGLMERFKRSISKLMESLSAAETEHILRYDWFIKTESLEAAVITVYRNEAAMLAHVDHAREHYETLGRSGSMSTDILCDETLRFRVPATFGSTRVFKFAEGMKSSAMVNTKPTNPTAAGGMPIEILTRFMFRPEEADAFKRAATQMLEIVKHRDTGTLRYDWYYDDADQCLAMDTYADSASMFSHMKHCAEKHQELLHHSTMTTDFLGELPAEAKAAVGKFSPYVLQLLQGLQKPSLKRAAQ